MTRAFARLIARLSLFPRSWSWIQSVEGDTDSFIVRIWREADDSAGNVLAWKVSIEHGGSDQYLYFQDLDMIAGFIQSRCRLPPWPDNRTSTGV